MREVQFYRTAAGDCPVEEFLDALTGKQAHGGETFRLIGFYDSTWFVVVSGFAKKTEKTPRQEIDVASARRQDYLSRRRTQ